MNQSTATQKEFITDYVTGFARNNPQGLAHLATYPDWQAAATVELKSRMTRFITNLTDAELTAISNGEVSINDIAQALQNKPST